MNELTELTYRDGTKCYVNLGVVKAIVPQSGGGVFLMTSTNPDGGILVQETSGMVNTLRNNALLEQEA